MNILVVAHYQGDGSPTASFIHDQVKAYCALGHHVRVISPIAFGKKGYLSGSRIKGETQICDHVPHYYLRYLSLSSYGEKCFNAASAVAALKLRLSAALKDFRPDVIHAHTLGFDSELGTWLKKKLGCPLVVTTHGSDTSARYAQGETAFLKACCDCADAVVGVSSRLTAKLADCGVTTPLHSILNGFAIELLSETEKTPGNWIQVGNLIPSKHVDTTLRAFAVHIKNYPTARLTIIGQGSERANLELLCADLGITHAVHFTGALSNQEVLANMAACQFFVMPSHPEGFGIVYLEAMANGCITIGTEGEGIADLIQSGKNGFLVPADDPEAIVQVIESCLTDPKKAAALAAAGQIAARKLTWEENAKQYIRLFTELTLPK